MGMKIETESDFEYYVQETLESEKQGACYPFIIVDKQTNEVAGSTRFGNINQKNEKCEIGWTWYGTQFQGTGLNKAAKSELLNFGFETLGFRRIQLSAELENIRSQKAIEKLGAQREAFLEIIILTPMGSVKTMCISVSLKKSGLNLSQLFFLSFISSRDIHNTFLIIISSAIFTKI